MRPWFVLVVLFVSISATAAVPQCNFPDCAYVTDAAGREVLAASSSGAVRVWQTPTGTSPEDLTVGPDKKIYVALTSTNQIGIVNVSGNTVSAQVKNLSGVSSPQGLRFAWNGDLYFNSTSGLWKLAAGANSPTQIAAVSFTRPGGVAFQSDGSVLFGGDNAVYRIGAQHGIPDTSNWQSTPLINATGVVGLAVDSVDNVYVAHQSVVDRYGPSGIFQKTWADFSSTSDLPQHIEVVPDMVLGANCNTINDLLWVSTYQIVSGKTINGKVWRVGNTSCTDTSSPSAASLIASITTKVNGKNAPAVGAGVGPSYRTLKKTYASGSATHVFNFGAFSHQLANDLLSGTTQPPCDATVTATQRSPIDLAATLSANSISGAPIAFYGEQGWVTTFVLNTPSCFTSQNGEQFSDHYLNAVYTPVNPKVVNIHANGTAALTETTGYFPSGPPADGTAAIPGDPGIGNRASRELFLINQSFSNTYTFSGFLSPLRDSSTVTPSDNVINYGQNITFKFQLFTTNGRLLSDTLAQALANQTVFALSRVTPTPERSGSPDASGQSIKEIPRFKYDSKSHQFLYTLDSGALNAPQGQSIWEATVISDTAGAGFLPHSLQFTIQN